MNIEIVKKIKSRNDELIKFARELARRWSLSRNNRNTAKDILNKITELSYKR